MVFKCKMCGASLNVTDATSMCECEYCGTKQTFLDRKSNENDTGNLLKLGHLALEDKNWKKAEAFFDSVLLDNAEDYRAYMGKLCAEFHVVNEESLASIGASLRESNNYKRACSFGGKEISKLLEDYVTEGEYQKKLRHYFDIVSQMKKASTSEELVAVAKAFQQMGDFRDAAQRVQECQETAILWEYNGVVERMNHATTSTDYMKLVESFKEFGDFQDAPAKVIECQQAVKESEIREHKEYLEQIRVAKPGDVIRFGSYEWGVIEINGNKKKLLSKKGVAKMPYHEPGGVITWEKCTLRKWLNEEFYNQFSDEEKQMIILTHNINWDVLLGWYDPSKDYFDIKDYVRNGGPETDDYIYLLSAGEARITYEAKYMGLDDGWCRSPEDDHADTISEGIRELASCAPLIVDLTSQHCASIHRRGVQETKMVYPTLTILVDSPDSEQEQSHIHDYLRQEIYKKADRELFCNRNDEGRMEAYVGFTALGDYKDSVVKAKKSKKNFLKKSVYGPRNEKRRQSIIVFSICAIIVLVVLAICCGCPAWAHFKASTFPYQEWGY